METILIVGSATQQAALFLALAKAKLKFGSVVKDRHVKVTSDRGRSYEFDYATLDAVFSATDTALSHEGLAVLDIPTSEALITLLTHMDGGYIQSSQLIPATRTQWDKDGGAARAVPLTMQERGSAITYLRRYARQGILGVAAEEDDDGNAADGNDSARSWRPSPAQAPKGERPHVSAPAGIAPPLQKTYSPAEIAGFHMQITELTRRLGWDAETANARVQELAGAQNLPTWSKAPAVLLAVIAKLQAQVAK